MSKDNQPDPILDEHIIDSLRRLGGLDEIAQEYVDEVRGRIKSIRHAMERHEFDRLKIEAHTLKGASGVVGAILLATIARQLEELAREKSTTGATTLLDKLDHDFAKTCAALDAEIAKSSIAQTPH